MAPSQVQVPWPASGAQPVSFRFPVSWTYLAEPLGSFQTGEKPSRAPVVLHTATTESVTCAVLAPPPPVQPVQEIAANPPFTDSWEMVIPKAGRPSARPSGGLGSAVSAGTAGSIAEIPASRVVVDVPKTVDVLKRVPKSAPKTVDVPQRVEVPKAVEVPNPEADLGLHTLQGFPQAPGMRVSAALKFAAPIVVVLAISSIVFFKITNVSATTKRIPAPVVSEVVEVGPALPVGRAGWIDNFAWRDGSRWGRRISVLRGSSTLTDFRLEFPGQIDSKALSWVYRVKDFKNFYVVRLELVRPLPEPAGALTHFAVIDGQEQARFRVPLSVPLRPNTVYNVRFDAVGSSFTTWIQGQKVDQWTDPQIREGGVGLYSELGDRNKLSGDIAVFGLSVKPQARK